jgi:uncharacterized protein DUF4157
MNMRVQSPTKPACASPPSFTRPPAGVLQRKCSCGGSAGSSGECAECKKKNTLQRRAASDAQPDAVPPIVHEVLSSPGQPLDTATRAFMEPRFRHDFGKVRIHADAKAADSAWAVSAGAYAFGKHIAFANGHYAPRTLAGRHLLAHELTHVVQQPSASGLLGPLRVGETGTASEREAEQAADAACSNGAGAPISTLAAPLVQRQPLNLQHNLPQTCAEKCGPTAQSNVNNCSDVNRLQFVVVAQNAAVKNVHEAMERYDTAMANPPLVETAAQLLLLRKSLKDNFAWSPGDSPSNLPATVRANLARAYNQLQGPYWIECSGGVGDGAAIMQGAVHGQTTNAGTQTVGTENCFAYNCIRVDPNLSAENAPHALVHEVFHRVLNTGNQALNASYDKTRGNPGYPGVVSPSGMNQRVGPAEALRMPDTYASLVDDLKGSFAPLLNTPAPGPTPSPTPSPSH